MTLLIYYNLYYLNKREEINIIDKPVNGVDIIPDNSDNVLEI